MLKSFCAAANLRALVQSDRCPDAIRTCAHLLDECYSQDQRGTLMNELRTLDSNLNGHLSKQEGAWDYDRNKFERLEPIIHEGLVKFFNSQYADGRIADTHALLHKEYEIRGLKIAEMNAGAKNTMGRHSTIFFQLKTNTELVPAVIRKIFSIPQKHGDIERQAVFLAIHRYRPLSASDGVEDPFVQYAGFGARLWSEDLGPLEIITPSQKICHAVSRRWQEGIYVLQAIDRVGYKVCV